MIKATQIHHGQYRPYGDSYDVWIIDTNEYMEFDDMLAWCRENLINGSTVPLEKQFYDIKAYDESFTWNDYFKGYVRLYQYPDGGKWSTWKFEKVRPYAD